MEIIERKRRRQGPSGTIKSIEEVVKSLKTDPSLSRAADWCNKVGPGVYLLYGHKEYDKEKLERFQSHTYMLSTFQRPGVDPLESSDWYRLGGAGRQFVEGQSGANVNHASWHCAACMEKWQFGLDSQYRLFVFRPPGELQEGDRVWYAFIGNSLNRNKAEMANIERQILILKGATMLEKVGGRAITKEVILRAIEALNEESAEKLSATTNVVNLYSADPKESQYSAKNIYCED